MAYKREIDQQYKSKWKSIVNFMKNSTGFKIAGVARAGSRRQGGWTNESDLDIRFAISRDPRKEVIYPKLKSLLEANFPDLRVWIGSSYNVIHMSKGSLKFDLILLQIHDFESQCRQNYLERL